MLFRGSLYVIAKNAIHETNETDETWDDLTFSRFLLRQLLNFLALD